MNSDAALMLSLYAGIGAVALVITFAIQIAVMGLKAWAAKVAKIAAGIAVSALLIGIGICAGLSVYNLLT